MLKPDSLTMLEPLKDPVVSAWNPDTGELGPLTDQERTKARIEETVAWYQTAHDLFRRGRLKEKTVMLRHEAER